jgi:hypothetical protein
MSQNPMGSPRPVSGIALNCTCILFFALRDCLCSLSERLYCVHGQLFKHFCPSTRCAPIVNVVCRGVNVYTVIIAYLNFIS